MVQVFLTFNFYFKKKTHFSLHWHSTLGYLLINSLFYQKMFDYDLFDYSYINIFLLIMISRV